VINRLFALLLAGLLLAVPAWSKETVYGMSKKTYDAINEIQIMIEEERYREAIAEVQELKERKLNGYEMAHALNMAGYLYFQLEDNARALAAYEEALQQEGLPESQIRGLLNSISQVALASGYYEVAERYARQLLATETEAPQPLSQVILAQALIGQEKWDEAIKPLKTAIAMQRAMGAAPRENWMGMLSSIYYTLERYEEMRDLLYEIIELYPSERYILNLAALHGQLEEPGKQLALVESLRDDERLEKGFHLLMLANLYVSQGTPLKAAQLLDREIAAGRIEATRQNLELNSQAWYMAGEEARAIPPLEAAAKNAKDGELYLRIARLHMDLYEYKAAERSARQALDKGGLDEPGDAWLLVGMALARGEKLEAARVAFIEAAEYESSEKWARQWLRFVDVEQERIAAFTLSPGGS
jgi:tetratricopeptide (TPR) repeat protein